MNRKQQRIVDKEMAVRHAEARRTVALKVFGEIDQLVDREVARATANGRAPTCAKGCSHCCRQEIYVPRAEAEAIVAWLETSAPELIADLRVRLIAWLEWYRDQCPKLIASGIPRGEAFRHHGTQCPALVDNTCSIYPVRPVFCRTYYVTSSPDNCRPAGDPDLIEAPINVLPIAHKVTPFASELRHLVESQGSDFQGSVHLLAEWLAHLLGVEQQPWRTSIVPG